MFIFLDFGQKNPSLPPPPPAPPTYLYATMVWSWRQPGASPLPCIASHLLFAENQTPQFIGEDRNFNSHSFESFAIIFSSETLFTNTVSPKVAQRHVAIPPSKHVEVLQQVDVVIMIMKRFSAVIHESSLAHFVCGQPLQPQNALPVVLQAFNNLIVKNCGMLASAGGHFLLLTER